MLSVTLTQTRTGQRADLLQLRQLDRDEGERALHRVLTQSVGSPFKRCFVFVLSPLNTSLYTGFTVH